MHLIECNFEGNSGGRGAAIYVSSTLYITTANFTNHPASQSTIVNNGSLYVENVNFNDQLMQVCLSSWKLIKISKKNSGNFGENGWRLMTSSEYSYDRVDTRTVRQLFFCRLHFRLIFQTRCRQLELSYIEWVYMWRHNDTCHPHVKSNRCQIRT